MGAAANAGDESAAAQQRNDDDARPAMKVLLTFLLLAAAAVAILWAGLENYTSRSSPSCRMSYMRPAYRAVTGLRGDDDLRWPLSKYSLLLYGDGRHWIHGTRRLPIPTRHTPTTSRTPFYCHF
jgi:hypothetical protein